MARHEPKPKLGGNVQTAELCEAERGIHEAMSLMQMVVNTVSLPAQALTMLLKVTFILFKALTSIQRAREIARGARGQAEDE